jgi:trk system potassium uptake protein TrkA
MKLARILTMPSLVNVDVFAQGRVAVVEARVQESSLAVGKPLSEVDMPPDVNLLAVFREDEILIPRPADVLRTGDRVLLAVLHPDTMGEIERIIGTPKSLVGEAEVKKVVIAGATRIGIHLARLLEDTKEVVLIDEREERCNEATERLSKSLVLNANATDRNVLVGEDVGSADAFVGAHPVEEYNILACLIGKSLGVRKTIALINQPELADMVEDIGIDLAISPRLATVGAILKWTHQVETLDVVVTHAGDAQILELKVSEDSKVANKPLRKAHLPDGCLIGAVVRGDKVLLPKGDDVLLPGDDIVLFALTDTIPRLKKLF